MARRATRAAMLHAESNRQLLLRLGARAVMRGGFLLYYPMSKPCAELAALRAFVETAKLELPAR